MLTGDWPPTVLLSGFAILPGLALMRLLGRYHDLPERISGSKFLALRFQLFNGLGLMLGLALAHVWL